MDELRPVRSSSPFGPASRVVGVLALVGLIAAIVKPWGAGSAILTGAEPTRAPTTRPSASPEPILDPAGYGSLRYDPSVFGEHEPSAAWGLWPASFLVTFGFVMQVPDAGAGASPAPAASRAAGSGPAATEVPGPRIASDGGPNWPARLVVPEGYHLFLMGINMPAGTTLASASLTSSGPASPGGLQLSTLASPWPTHFVVLGILLGSGQLKVWPPNTYRLAMSFAPGDITRSIDIVIPKLPGGG